VRNTPADGWHLEEKARRLNYTQPTWSTRYPRLAAITADSKIHLPESMPAQSAIPPMK
jgi:hypothetical protein